MSFLVLRCTVCTFDDSSEADSRTGYVARIWDGFDQPARFTKPRLGHPNRKTAGRSPDWSLVVNLNISNKELVDWMISEFGYGESNRLRGLKTTRPAGCTVSGSISCLYIQSSLHVVNNKVGSLRYTRLRFRDIGSVWLIHPFLAHK